MVRHLLLLPALVLTSCDTPESVLVDPGPGSSGDQGDDPQDTDDDGGDDEVEPVEIDIAKALTRASLDLRGVRPTQEELETVLASPDAYEQMVEDYLHGERFGPRVRDLFSEIYLTRQDYYYVYGYEFGIDDEVAFAASVGEEPLQLLSHIAVNDLPYTEIVRADYTMANEVLGEAFPVDYPDGATGWQPAQYTDGRPQAGILTMNGMWWRYESTTSNANRGRANAVNKILVCHDYLSKPIEFDRNVNLLDEEALSNALKSNEGCVGCHASLEPTAAYFWGFYHYFYFSKTELNYYHSEREFWWEDYNGAAPGWMGEPGYNLNDLGRQIAADSRLVECITTQVFEQLMQRDAVIGDMNTLTAYREDFLDDELALRSLFRNVMLSEEYQARVDQDGQLQPKMLTPAQLGDSVEALTGFRFEYYGYDLLASDSYGVRTLAGGVDGVYATKPAREPTATIALVQERIGQAAAMYAAEHDRDNPDEARLFTEISFNETPSSDPEAMAAQIQRLHLLLFGNEVAVDGQEVQANLGLWEDLYAIEGSKQLAWAGLLSVLLRDPEFIFY